jgi:flagellar motor switch protein FliM
MNDSMSKEKIQQLLKAVGSRPQTDDSSIKFEQMNWNEPHYFNKSQLVKLDAFVKNIPAAISEKISALCRKQFDVEITKVSQHYAGEFLDEANKSQAKNYYLSFGSGQGKEFGVLTIPGQTAVIWAKLLLGDSESKEDSVRELSKLEESLLYDLAVVLVKSLSSANPKCQYNPSGNIASGQFPINLQNTQELCRISFSVKTAGSESKSDAYFLISSDKLEVITGKNKNSSEDSASQDFSKLILGYLGFSPVNVTVQLACSRLSFEGLMNLQADDIIMLDKSIDEPIELVVEGKTFGYGWPAKSEGQYAVTIASIEN